MTTQKKLEAKGYKIAYTMQGNVIATKGQRTYAAKNITQLYNMLFK